MNSVVECFRGKSVRVFRLDQAGARERLLMAARRLLAERPDVISVSLFGSLARGDACPGSDADLLVVLRDGAAPFLERLDSLYAAFGDAGIGCDILAYTETELRLLREEGNAFVSGAVRDAIPLATREQG